MIKGDYDKLEDIAKHNVCAEHKTPLVVAWHSGEKCWTLRCGMGETIIPGFERRRDGGGTSAVITGHYPDAVTRQLSLTELDKAGQLPSGPIQDNIRKRQRGKAMQEDDKPKDDRHWLLPVADLGTGELLRPEFLTALVRYTHKYELDPYRSHVVLMYGKPYITIDGYLYHAMKSQKPYTLSSRPLTQEERGQYQIEDADHAWVAEVQFTDTGSTFTGLGIVTQGEITAKSEKNPVKLRSPVVAAHPWLLAQKRAEWQALRKAFPIGETQDEKEV